MEVKNYRGRSAEECFQKLKAEMGRDAVILQSRSIRPYFGKFGSPIHEIVAASDINAIRDSFDNRPGRGSADGGATERSSASLARPSVLARPMPGGVLERRAGLRAAISAAAAAPSDTADDRLSRIEKQISVLAEMVEQVANAGKPAEPKQVLKPEGGIGGFLRYKVSAEAVETPLEGPVLPEPLKAHPYGPLFDTLRRAKVAEALIRRLLGELPEGKEIGEARSLLHDLIARRILIGDPVTATPGKMTIRALVGPAGAGKTTTIAKLAANLSLTEGASVAMITLDTQRVAASQQLMTYGEILKIPVKVAYDKADLEAYLAEFAKQNVQVVLIDTPGRGPEETLPLAEMSTSLREIVDLKSYLVVPATHSASNFENTILRFNKLAGPVALVVSKLDETVDNQCLGYMINAQAKYHLPLAYLTVGSRVPDDLLAADAHVVASKLLATSVMSC